MPDLCTRFPQNPILRPRDVKPSREDMVVECLLNPGAFKFGGKTGLLLRVAERPRQEAGWASTPVLDPDSPGGIRVVRIRLDDPDLDFSDPRVMVYRGKAYLSTLSHLRLAWSDDGIHFAAEPVPTLLGHGPLETFGIEDSRVAFVDGQYRLTFTAVSEAGVGVGMISTRDWKTFERHGLIFPPHNKDCALFPQRIGGHFHSLHRPSGAGLGGNFIWTARSPDLIHWGDHRCIAMTRAGAWDSQRVGAGAEPILTDRGWLEIYNGANDDKRYCLGLLLLDREDPTRVLARSREPVLWPREPYELTGFFGNVVFTNGHVADGDRVTIYYGASDEVICAATASIKELLKTLD
ncbi:MAG: glycoside hydrolase family 130 protein [Planctomycetota bacterium]|nr:glycoside hydrolase family 130 protein [Planctomycetota bacterium]